MNSEFFLALDEIERDKGIPKTYMLERVNQALLAAVRKANPSVAEGVVVDVNEDKKEIGVYIEKNVVAGEPESPLEVTVEQAKLVRPNAEPGDVVRYPVETKQFGRIAAQAAKQVIIQGIREAERGMVFEQFTSREHEVLTGVVHRIDPKSGNVYMKVSNKGDVTEAIMLAGERIPGEEIKEGDRLKVYVVEVRRSSHGPQIIISRTHPGLVKRLFELEVPEIFDGIVEIKSIAREAGSRTKIAVASNDPEVDAIGACVGTKGARVDNVVNELAGEKIDIVNYSDDIEKFVASALAPAEVYSAVLVGESQRSCRVVVPDNQLSLAIGKEGKNARLAAKLTNCKIDIKPASQMMETGSIKIDLSKLDLAEEKPAEEEPEAEAEPETEAAEGAEE